MLTSFRYANLLSSSVLVTDRLLINCHGVRMPTKMTQGAGRILCLGVDNTLPASGLYACMSSLDVQIISE